MITDREYINILEEEIIRLKDMANLYVNFLETKEQSKEFDEYSKTYGGGK